jgi:cytoskeletal protein CcmA (bactofilin family)
MLWDKKSASTVTEEPEERLALSVPSGDGHQASVPAVIPQWEEPKSTNPKKAITPTAASPSQTILGQVVIVKGDLSGKEDLLIEGQCEGTLNFQDHCLTVGPQGQVKSEIHARRVVIHGMVTGRITAKDRVEIRKTGTIVGDVVSAGVAIEDGAFFKGSIEIVREGKPELTRAVAAAG